MSGKQYAVLFAGLLLCLLLGAAIPLVGAAEYGDAPVHFPGSGDFMDGLILSLIILLGVVALAVILRAVLRAIWRATR